MLVVDVVPLETTTVPVALSFSAVIDVIISTLSTVADEIKISFSAELIWNREPNPLDACDGTMTTLKTSGDNWLCTNAANSEK